MKFEWDDRKNVKNHEKHSIWFEEAQTIWADTHAAEFFDPDHSESEYRFIRVGYSHAKRILVVVFCERHKDSVRIISARKATPTEKKAHEEGI